MNKAAEVKKCLADAQRLGMDLAGLEVCKLNAFEKIQQKYALENLDRIVNALNAIHPGKTAAELAREAAANEAKP